MGRRSILSLSGLDWITRFVCVKTSGCGLILLTITKSSHSGPQSRSLAGTGVVCPFAESGNRLDPISRPCSQPQHLDRKSTRLNSSHCFISYVGLIADQQSKKRALLAVAHSLMV